MTAFHCLVSIIIYVCLTVNSHRSYRNNNNNNNNNVIFLINGLFARGFSLISPSGVIHVREAVVTRSGRKEHFLSEFSRQPQIGAPRLTHLPYNRATKLLDFYYTARKHTLVHYYRLSVTSTRNLHRNCVV
jgi:hypothetical protein